MSIILVWLGRGRIGIKVEVRKEVIRKKAKLGVRKQSKKKVGNRMSLRSIEQFQFPKKLPIYSSLTKMFNY